MPIYPAKSTHRSIWGTFRVVILISICVTLLLAAFFIALRSGGAVAPTAVVPAADIHTAATTIPAAFDTQATEIRYPTNSDTAPTQEAIVAVNGTILGVSDFEEVFAIDTALTGLWGGVQPTRRAVLEQWINRTLLRQAAPDSHTPNGDELLAALLAQRNLTEDELLLALAAAGVNEASFHLYFQELLDVQSVPATVDLRELQAAAHISFGPHTADLFVEPTPQPDGELASATVISATSKPQPLVEATLTTAVVESATPTPAETTGPPSLEVRGTAPGVLAPDFRLSLLLPDSSDAPTETIAFADLPGAPTLLSFWTTWCPYCRQQTPILVDAFHRFEGDGLRFLGIDVKEDPAIVQAYVQNNQIPYSIALDQDGAVAEAFLVRGFPTTYFLDAEGRVVARHVGQLTSELIDDYISRLLPAISEGN